MVARRVAGQPRPARPPDLSNVYSVQLAAAKRPGPGVFLRHRLLGRRRPRVDAHRPRRRRRRASRRSPRKGRWTIKVSCATCHDSARGGVDTTSVPGHVSVGAGWTDVNALTIINSAYRQVVFWNGRVDSLWALNVVVAESATTMNGNRLRTGAPDRRRYRDGLRRRVRGALRAPARSERRQRRRVPLPASPSGKAGAPDGAWESRWPPDGSQADRSTGSWRTGARRSRPTSTADQRRFAFDEFVAAGHGSTLISGAAKRGARLFVGKAGVHRLPQRPPAHRRGVPQRRRSADRPGGSDDVAVSR